MLIENVFTNKKYKAYIGRRKKYIFSKKKVKSEKQFSLNNVLCREVRVHQIVYEAENVLTPKGNFIFCVPNFRIQVEFLCTVLSIRNRHLIKIANVNYIQKINN